MIRNFLLSFCAVCQLNAATYYVAKTGSNSNIGSEASPWLTIQKAAETMAPGDTVLVKVGTYLERLIPRTNNLTFRVYSTDVVTINPSTAPEPYSAVLISGRSGITIDGFRLTGATSVGLWTTSATNCVITNVIAYSNVSAGIYMDDYSQTITVTGCRTYSNGDPTRGTGGIVTIGNGGSPAARRPTGIIVTNCVTHNNSHQGIWIDASADVLVTDNVTYSNGASGIQVETACSDIWIRRNEAMKNNWYFPNEAGIWIDEAARGVVEENEVYENQHGITVGQSYFYIVRRNKAWNNKAQYVNDFPPSWTIADGRLRSVALAISEGGDNPAIHNSQPRGASTNRWAHETYYDNGHSTSLGVIRILHSNAQIVQNKWHNSIMSTSGALREWHSIDADAMTSINYNLYYNPSRALAFHWDGSEWGWDSWRTLGGRDANGINANPSMTNPSAQDFTLADGSPAIDTGGWLTTVTSTSSGTAMPVADPYWFSDGWGVPGVTGDTVKLAGGGSSVISSINYGTKVITLASPLSWTSGEGVAYTYTGNAPDIGALERVTTPSPAVVRLEAQPFDNDVPKMFEVGTVAKSVVVRRTGPTTSDLVGNWAWSGDVQYGVNFTLTGGNASTWTIPAGASYVAYPIVVVNDGVYSSLLQATSTITSGSGYTVGGAALSWQWVDATPQPSLDTGRDPSGQTTTQGRRL